MTDSPVPPGRLQDGTECRHEGQTSTYCTKCWINLLEARQGLSRGGTHVAAPRLVPIKYRTFWRRYWAGSIDGLLFYPLSFIDNWVYRSTAPPAVHAVWFLASSFLFIGYSIGMHAKFGQTLGKMVTRVKVLDVSETKLSIRQALLRDAVPVVLSLAFVVVCLPRVLGGGTPMETVPHQWDTATWMLGYASVGWYFLELVTMLTNHRRRALHDFIAGSVVVRTGRAATLSSGDSEAAK